MATDINATQISDRPFEPPRAATSGSSKLGKDEFVKLLLTQLKQQDPTSPADSQAFVAQLAQFAQVELATNTNSNLEQLIMGQAATRQTDVVGLVGKDVLYRSDAISLTVGGSPQATTTLPQDAGAVTAVITNDAGKTVRTIQLGAHAAGEVTATWDGRDEQGRVMAPGSYHMRITASDKEGKNIPLATQARARVHGIAFEDGVPQVLIGDTKIKLSDIVEITERNAP
jgi:flagellar basal-body rod modification protein FlgD